MEKIQPCMCFRLTSACIIPCYALFFVIPFLVSNTVTSSLLYDIVFALCCRTNCSIMFYFELYKKVLYFDILFSFLSLTFQICSHGSP